MSISDSYYQEHYEAITNTGLVGMVSKCVHVSMERKPYASLNHSRDTVEATILEVGAGHGQHVQYVPKSYKKYIQSDFRRDLLINAPEYPNVSSFPEPVDAQQLPFKDNEFDRLIATCLLIHLNEPEKALSEWGRVVRKAGRITIYVPNECGALLKVAQALTTRRKQKALGIDANYLHYSEHRYNYNYLVAIIRKMYGKDVVRRGFPFIIPSFNLNLWTVITIKNP